MQTFWEDKLINLMASSSPAAASDDPLGLKASSRTGKANLVATLSNSPDGSLYACMHACSDNFVLHDDFQQFDSKAAAIIHRCPWQCHWQNEIEINN